MQAPSAPDLRCSLSFLATFVALFSLAWGCTPPQPEPDIQTTERGRSDKVFPTGPSAGSKSSLTNTTGPISSAVKSPNSLSQEEPPKSGVHLAEAVATAGLRVSVARLAMPWRARLVPPKELPQNYLSFPDACLPGEEFTLSFVGDILVHTDLQKQALVKELRYRDIWSPVQDLLTRSDLTYGNLEGPSARNVNAMRKVVDDPGFVFDKHVYTGYPEFNYHHFLLDDLVLSGFDLVSTANNHSVDRGSIGIDRTISALSDANLPGFGTRRKDAKSEAPWFIITETRGLRLAWAACTKHTNGKKDYGQVMRCYDDIKGSKRNPNPAFVALVKELHEREDIDAVIVTPHFGKSYKPKPNKRQQKAAHAWIDAGALAVIGSHTHNLQPWERYRSKDGREGFIMYSMGNFISTQGGLNKRSTVLLNMSLSRRSHDGSVSIRGVQFVPMYMVKKGSKRRKEYQIEALKRLDEEDYVWVRTHIAKVVGAINFQNPDEPFENAPHCNPDWEGWKKVERNPEKP